MALAILWFAIVSVLSGAIAQPAGDLITSLPNYDGPLGVQYSGYITVNASAGKRLHYWFVQSTSGSHETDPLVLWMNGGPGCSSMDGFFYEHGPFQFAANSTPEAVYLQQNPNSWSRVANMLYVEAPAGVGFSYDSSGDYATDDNLTASENYQFIKNWLVEFPMYADNPFWITGESYAGIYVPTLAEKVNNDAAINFQGVMVGNGVSDARFDSLLASQLPFAYGHGIISQATFSEVMMYCQGEDYNATMCQQLVEFVYSQYQNVDVYNIYGDCYQTARYRQARSPLAAWGLSLQPTEPTAVPPCTDAMAATAYLNDPAVQAAIHVTASDATWAICSDAVGSSYSQTINSTLPIYRELMAKNRQILIYSGDCDNMVPYVGSAGWINSMQLPVTGRNWEPWFYTDPVGKQVAGWVSEFKGLTFATIRGAGHMVPQYRPLAAFAMFSRFLGGQPL